MKFIEAFMDKEASNGREWTDGHHVYRRVCDTMECRLISETDGWKIVDSQVCTMHHDVEWADTLKTRDALWQPIETAPKDGRKIIASDFPYDYVYVAAYNGSHFYTEPGQYVCSPNYWMPIPPLPEGER